MEFALAKIIIAIPTSGAEARDDRPDFEFYDSLGGRDSSTFSRKKITNPQREFDLSLLYSVSLLGILLVLAKGLRVSRSQSFEGRVTHMLLVDRFCSRPCLSRQSSSISRSAALPVDRSEFGA